MFDFLKKEELLRIDWLEKEVTRLEKYIEAQEAALHDYRVKVINLQDEVNSKKIVVCKNRDCLDWDNGTCSLKEIIITASLDALSKNDKGEYINQSRCEDFDPGKEMKKEMDEELKSMPLDAKIKMAGGKVIVGDFK